MAFAGGLLRLTRLVGSFVLPFVAVLASGAQSAAPAGASPAPAGGGAASQPSGIHWQKGPVKVKVGDAAELAVPEGYEFADGEGARKALELSQNPASGKEVGILQPVNDAPADNWVAYFEFENTGYVKDEEGSHIDAPALLKSMQKATEEDNVERKKRGWEPFHLTGWQTEPFYDSRTHNLTWGTLGKTDNPKDGLTVNYATRILGRRGVMRTDLVMDPSQAAAIPRFQQLMTGFTFTPGSRYADFVAGDKVAEFGLTALIAGGATAVAIKSGFFAKLLAMMAAGWKVLAVAFAGLMTRMKKMLAAVRRKFGKGDPDEPAPQTL